MLRSHSLTTKHFTCCAKQIKMTLDLKLILSYSGGDICCGSWCITVRNERGLGTLFHRLQTHSFTFLAPRHCIVCMRRLEYTYSRGSHTYSGRGRGSTHPSESESSACLSFMAARTMDACNRLCSIGFGPDVGSPRA